MGALHLHFPSVPAVEACYPNLLGPNVTRDEAYTSGQRSADNCFSDPKAFFIG